MRNAIKVMAITLGLAITQHTLMHQKATAQVPLAGPEYDIFKGDVGEWDVEITNYASGSPEVTNGSESNRMLGDFWLVSDFEGTMLGLDFKGHGSTGYDAETKQYVGTWIDSLSPGMMHMKGGYDKEKRALTLVGMAPGPDGQPAKHRLTTVYKDGFRVMTMYITPKGGEEAKFMQLVYSRKK